VFELFAQADRNSDRSQGGLGLGLALVKSLVELHGGTVAADSEGEHKGSTFTITLPRHAGPAAHAASATTATGGASLRVLVVDDNVDAAQTLQLLLKRVRTPGHRRATALEALALAQASTAPQLCLLDIGLPDISGYDLARSLRALPATAKAMLVAVTGYGRRADRDLAAAAGFDHYFVKPVDVDALLALIARLAPAAQDA
jgi:CheY-like chemotaxis protein